MVFRWNDFYRTKSKHVVSMMSTKHVGILKDSGKTHFVANVLDYNKTMGGVDTLSRVVHPYSIQRKGLKWYRKLGELFIDFAIFNYFVIYGKVNIYTEHTHLQFRQNLHLSICVANNQIKLDLTTIITPCG